jgi:hypothetical protein
MPDEKINDLRVHFMPESVHSSTKVCTLSGAPHVPLPAKLAPITEEMERKIIFALMKELNDTYALNVPEQPVLSRTSRRPCRTQYGNNRSLKAGLEGRSGSAS